MRKSPAFENESVSDYLIKSNHNFGQFNHSLNLISIKSFNTFDRDGAGVGAGSGAGWLLRISSQTR